MKINRFEGIKSLIKLSQKNLSRGLVLIIEGVEGVGKTTACALLHEKLLMNNINSELLVNYYERTDKTGPLIAAITENPCIKIEDNLTLFLLYCARMTDKLFASIKLSCNRDIVIVDRMDVSLYARAVFGWVIDQSFVEVLLNQLCAELYKDRQGYLIICLDATKDIRKSRLNENAKFRRRSSMPDQIADNAHKELLELCRFKNIPIIDTSHISIAETVNRIDQICCEEFENR